MIDRLVVFVSVNICELFLNMICGMVDNGENWVV